MNKMVFYKYMQICVRALYLSYKVISTENIGKSIDGWFQLTMKNKVK